MEWHSCGHGPESTEGLKRQRMQEAGQTFPWRPQGQGDDRTWGREAIWGSTLGGRETIARKGQRAEVLTDNWERNIWG